MYTRWGRTVCSEESDLMYRGASGGSGYNTHGGGSNYLCLPNDPEWGVYNEAVEKVGKLYGAEYKSAYGFSKENSNGKPVNNHDVPCAVCVSRTMRSVVMVPARLSCYDGWTVEYRGYLMSAHPGHQGRTQFICVDGSPETEPSGFRDDSGALMYHVEAVCGSLPCPPYTPRRELVCVVCSK